MNSTRHTALALLLTLACSSSSSRPGDAGLPGTGGNGGTSSGGSGGTSSGGSGGTPSGGSGGTPVTPDAGPADAPVGGADGSVPVDAALPPTATTAFVYVGGTWGGTQISWFQLDLKTGALTSRGTVPA